MLLGLAFLTLSACQRPEDQARQRLERMDYPVNPDGAVQAAAAGDYEALELFAVADVDLNAVSEDGFTPLGKAAEQGRLEALDTLLELEADPNRKGGGGWTPLMRAAFANQAAVVDRLLEAGADPLLVDENGWTAFMKAVFHGHTEVARLLFELTPGQQVRALMVASLLGHLPTVEMILDGGVDVDSQFDGDGMNQTALMYAALYDQKDIATRLLRRGANPFIVNVDGETAASLALDKGHLDLALFIEQSADAMAETVAVVEPDPADEMADIPAMEGEEVVDAGDEETVIAQVDQTEMIEEVESPDLPEADTTLPTAPESDEASVVAEVDTEEVDVAETPAEVGDVAMADSGDSSWEPDLPQAADRADEPVMMAFESNPLPFVVTRTGPGWAEVQFDSGPIGSQRVSVGESVAGQPFRLTEARFRRDADKDGEHYEAMEADFIHTTTGNPVRMLAGEETPSPDASAVIRFPGHEELRVRRGQEVLLEGPPPARYRVAEIRPTQVLLEDIDHGGMITLFLED